MILCRTRILDQAITIDVIIKCDGNRRANHYGSPFRDKQVAARGEHAAADVCHETIPRTNPFRHGDRDLGRRDASGAVVVVYMTSLCA